jgi:hypothetical protein
LPELHQHFVDRTVYRGNFLHRASPSQGAMNGPAGRSLRSAGTDNQE